MRRIACILWASVAALAGCVQMPTEKQQAVDLRPQLSFAVGNPNLNPLALSVFIDGAPMGAVGAYLAGQQAVRVLPGMHVVRVVSGSSVVLEEQVYVGDGMTKTIQVN